VPLFLNNQDQEESISAGEAIDALEEGIRQLAHRTSIEDALVWATSKPIVRVMPGFFKDGDLVTLTLPGDPSFPTIPGWDVPEETRFVLQDGARWQPLKV